MIFNIAQRVKEGNEGLYLENVKNEQNKFLQLAKINVKTNDEENRNTNKTV
jgi:hypothetical protein